MKTAILLLLASLLAVADVKAQRPDTLATRVEARQIIVPVALTAAGSLCSASHWWRQHIDYEVDHAIGSHRSWRIAEGAEWLPYAAQIGLGAIGVDARCGIVDRTLLSVTSFVILEAITQPVKRVVGRRRPDGSDNRSFPSGHTATAFAGAELMRLTYGNAWGAAGYTVAAGVAAMRMAGRHHWLSDCIAGAGIGILSARAATWLLPLERRLLRLDRRQGGASASASTTSRSYELAVVPAASPRAVGCTILLTL